METELRENVYTADHPEVVAAARFLAPIFSVEGWTYGWDNPHIPDSTELAQMIATLVSIQEGRPPEERGTCSSGRISVSYDRESSITNYHISLEVGKLSPPDVPGD